MPKKNPEHGARLEIRLPEAMLKAMRWTADIDKLTFSGWIRDALNRRTFTLRLDRRARFNRECLIRGEYGGQVIAERAPSDTLEWLGHRRGHKIEVRTYADIDGDGKTHAGALPKSQKFDQNRQDMILDRVKARDELRKWFHRWGREGKTCRLLHDESSEAQRLLAKFDRDMF